MMDASRASLIVLLGFLSGVGCDSRSASDDAAGTPPATVLREADLNILELSADAAQRLGIEVVPIAVERLPSTRLAGAVVEPRPGAAIAIRAPIAARVGAAIDGAAGELRVGRRVEAGEELLRLTPILGAEGQLAMATQRIEAAGALERAKVEIEAATLARERAEALLADGSGSQRDADEARARHAAAEASLRAASATAQFLESANFAETTEGFTMPIRAPMAAMITAVHAQPGETVPAAEPLLELSDLDRVWLRVSIYAGDLASIDTNANARIAALDDVTGAGAREAEPAGAPPSANPSAASVDLWYSIDNRDGAMVPGQRWNARLPLKSDSDQLALPWPAVVYDIHGGAWVYERVAELRFVRRRVVVERLARTSSGGERAVLAAGPPEGTEIVVAGAAELFGAEFGVGG